MDAIGRHGVARGRLRRRTAGALKGALHAALLGTLAVPQAWSQQPLDPLMRPESKEQERPPLDPLLQQPNGGAVEPAPLDPLLRSDSAEEPPSEGATFTIDISGTPAVVFSGECRLRTERGEETLTLEGNTPLRREVSGEALSCEITQVSEEGGLTVAISSDQGNVARSRTRGPGSSVRVSM